MGGVKITEEKKTRKKKLRQLVSFVAVLFAAFFLARGYYGNPDNYRVFKPAYHLAPTIHASLAAREAENSFRFVVYGDTRGNPSVHYRLTNLMKERRPDFVIHVGDMVKDGRREIYWDEFFSAANNLRDIPIYPCSGNHERFFDLHKLFSIPGEEQFYSFNYGKCHFSFLNSNRFSRKQLNWLREQLHKNHDKNKFVFFHHPFDKALYASTGILKELEQIIEEFSVSAVFNGHVRNYQRRESNGTIYIVTGGGGEPLSYSGNSEIKILQHHFVLMDVSEGRIHGKAISVDDEVLDEFDVE